MTQEHPITPPPELVKKWASALAFGGQTDAFTQAARWGADQELKACCEWLLDNGNDLLSPEMRKDRRPKPPSLKAQAFAIVENLGICDHLSPKDEQIIRRALESLPD